MDSREDLRNALTETLDALESLMSEANLGASCLTANTIRKINEVPLKARRVLRSSTSAVNEAKRR